MKNREFTAEQILESKAFVKTSGSGTTTFPSPQQIFDGILDIQKDKFDIDVQATEKYAVINANEDKTENIAFSRFNLKYSFKLDDELQYDLGLIVALDKGKPIAKIYSGVHVTACLNMCLFGADQYRKFDGTNFDVNIFKSYFKKEFDKIEENVKRSREIIKLLKSVNLSREKVHVLNGAILRNIIENNVIAGTNPVINGIKLQSDKNSKYFVDESTNAWLYFNTLTEYLNEKVHILDIPEKALSLFECVKEYLKDEFTNAQTNNIKRISKVKAS